MFGYLLVSNDLRQALNWMFCWTSTFNNTDDSETAPANNENNINSVNLATTFKKAKKRKKAPAKQKINLKARKVKHELKSTTFRLETYGGFKNVLVKFFEDKLIDKKDVTLTPGPNPDVILKKLPITPENPKKLVSIYNNSILIRLLVGMYYAYDDVSRANDNFSSENKNKISRRISALISNPKLTIIDIRKAIIEIAAIGYGFYPTLSLYRAKGGHVKTSITIDISGKSQFNDIFFSFFTNIIETYNSIQAIGGYENYRQFSTTNEFNYISKPTAYTLQPPKDGNDATLAAAKIGYAGEKATKDDIWADANASGCKGIPLNSLNNVTPYGVKDLGTLPSYLDWTIMIYGGKPDRLHGFNKHIADRIILAFITIFRYYNRNNFTDKVELDKFIAQLAPGLHCWGGFYRACCKRSGCGSVHAWGLALDWDTQRTAERWPKICGRFNQLIYRPFIEILKHYGMRSLGEHENWDWMHFQMTNWDSADNDKNWKPKDQPAINTD